MQSFVDEFVALLPQDARVADLGAHTGMFSVLFQQHGFRVTAVERGEHQPVPGMEWVHGDIPTGLFFGATENEFALAHKLGPRYQFCFVSLHPESLSNAFLSAAEVDRRAKTKRIQYQINLG